VAEEQITSILDYADGPYTDRQKAALRFTELFVVHHLGIDDEVMAETKRYLDDGEIVELGLFIASHLGVGRLLAVLDADPDAVL
jgi:alkylhydroperoxidase family enzyme